MFCNNCGMKLEDDAVFCTNCGAKVMPQNMESDDDDKTVLLNEEFDRMENVQAAPGENDMQAEEVYSGSHDGREQETTGQGESETEAPKVAEEVPEYVQEGSEKEAVGVEKVETVEISPTGAVETGTAMVVPSGPEQKKFCPNCGAPNGINDMFCQACGMFFGNPAQKPQGGNAAAIGKKSGLWKYAVMIAAVLAAVVLGAVFVPRFLGGGQTAGSQDLDFVMYLKDNELTMARKSKYEPAVVGDRFFEDDSISALERNYSYDPGDLVTCSPDHKYVYYPQKADESGFDLYCRKLGNKMEEDQKIDSQVIDYEVIDNDRLVYIKDDTDRKMYLYQKGESEKIASDVWWRKVSADGKYIMWRSDEKLYVQDTNLKSDKVKLESDISDIYGVSDDFNTIVYQKDENLYVMKKMEEKEKIASDILAYVYDINRNVKIYYLKERGEDSVSYYDLIEDDFLDQDNRMEEPRIEDYQRITYKDTFWGMQESVEVNDSYYEEMEKYQQKVNRDSLRGALQNNTINMQEWDVYYYDAAVNESSKVMTVTMKSGEYFYGSVGTDTALMYVDNVDLEAVEGLKLSRLVNVDYYEMQNQIEEKLAEGRQLLYLENGDVHEIEDLESENMYRYVQANEKSGMLYIYTSGGKHSELYSVNYGKKDASAELITDELRYVASYNLDEVCYINEDDELYYGDTRIDEDVDDVQVLDDRWIFYMTDMDKDGDEGTLHMYKDGKGVKIADDVARYSYGVFDGGKVAYLSDYNFKKYRGDLNVYDGKDVKRIDSDVMAIFSVGFGQ